jgi:hypothetical protein
MFLTVTLGTIRVEGFGGRFGLITDSSGVCPAESWVRPFAKAVPTGLLLAYEQIYVSYLRLFANQSFSTKNKRSPH